MAALISFFSFLLFAGRRPRIFGCLGYRKELDPTYGAKCNGVMRSHPMLAPGWQAGVVACLVNLDVPKLTEHVDAIVYTLTP